MPSITAVYQTLSIVHTRSTCHVTICSNAKQVADWYVLRFGFEHVAYKGLETGCRDTATHVVRQNKILFAFTSPLNPVASDVAHDIAVSGDMVKDVAFTVDDCRGIFKVTIHGVQMWLVVMAVGGLSALDT